MHNILMVYRQVELTFDENGNVVWPDAEPKTITLSYDEKPGVQVIAKVTDDLLLAQRHGYVGRDSKYDQGDKIRSIFDNHSIYTSKEIREYLATVPDRFEFAFTPKHGSWLN